MSIYYSSIIDLDTSLTINARGCSSRTKTTKPESIRLHRLAKKLIITFRVSEIPVGSEIGSIPLQVEKEAKR